MIASWKLGVLAVMSSSLMMIGCASGASDTAASSDELSRECITTFTTCIRTARTSAERDACSAAFRACGSTRTDAAVSPVGDGGTGSSTSSCEIRGTEDGVSYGIRCEGSAGAVTCTCESGGTTRTCTQSTLTCSTEEGCCSE